MYISYTVLYEVLLKRQMMTNKFTSLTENFKNFKRISNVEEQTVITSPPTVTFSNLINTLVIKDKKS